MPSTNSAATISIAGTLPAAARCGAALTADPDGAHGEGRGIERDEVGARAGGDTAVVGGADRPRGVAGRGAARPPRARRRARRRAAPRRPS